MEPLRDAWKGQIAAPDGSRLGQSKPAFYFATLVGSLQRSTSTTKSRYHGTIHSEPRITPFLRPIWDTEWARRGARSPQSVESAEAFLDGKPIRVLNAK